MHSHVSLSDNKLLKEEPEKLKFIVANDRVNKKHVINGTIIRKNANEYQYMVNSTKSEPLEVLTAKKVFFGYEIILKKKDGQKKRLGYLRKYSFKNYFVLFQEDCDKVLVKFKNVVLNAMRFRTIQVCLDFEKGSVLQKHQKRLTDKLYNLVNRMPKYDPVKNTYTLKFDHTKIIASYKNFQLVSPLMPDHVTLSLGMLEDNKWTICHSFPWTATQAFSIALAAIIKDE